MGERVAWSREDIIVAYALYCICLLYTSDAADD